MQVRCLSERSRVQSAGYNELALNCMDVLTAVIGAVCDALLLRGMLSTLCAALRPAAQPPLRLCLAAAGLIARAFARHASMTPDIYGALHHVHVTVRQCGTDVKCCCWAHRLRLCISWTCYST